MVFAFFDNLACWMYAGPKYVSRCVFITLLLQGVVQIYFITFYMITGMNGFSDLKDW